MVLPASWRPTPTADLVRLGNPHDGGYVLPRSALAPARRLVSMGLNDDWSFEADYLEATGGSVVCFDHTVNAEFWLEKALKNVFRRRWGKVVDAQRYRTFFARSDAEHRRTMVGYDQPGSVSLRTILTEYDEPELGLKIDIEGWEYRLLDQVVESQERFAFVVLEFHDVDLMADRVTRFLEQADQLQVVWTHANNAGGIDDEGDPLVVEMALVARRHLLDGPADGAANGAAAAAAALSTTNFTYLPDVEVRFAAS